MQSLIPSNLDLIIWKKNLHKLSCNLHTEMLILMFLYLKHLVSMYFSCISLYTRHKNRSCRFGNEISYSWSEYGLKYEGSRNCFRNSLSQLSPVAFWVAFLPSLVFCFEDYMHINGLYPYFFFKPCKLIVRYFAVRVIIITGARIIGYWSHQSWQSEAAGTQSICLDLFDSSCITVI